MFVGTIGDFGHAVHVHMTALTSKLIFQVLTLVDRHFVQVDHDVSFGKGLFLRYYFEFGYSFLQGIYTINLVHQFLYFLSMEFVFLSSSRVLRVTLLRFVS